MKPQRKAVVLPNGTEFEFWSPPITLAQRAKASKQAGTNDAASSALQLLVMVAQTENGEQLFNVGDLAELRNAFPANVVESLMLQMLTDDQGEDEEGNEALDMKSDKGAAKQRQSAAG